MRHRTTSKGAAALLGAVLLAAPSLAFADPPTADPDPWFAPDKAEHFAVSAAITAGGYGAMGLFTRDARIRLAFGTALGLAAGTGRELSKLGGAEGPSGKDFAWDVVGVAVGVGVALAVDALTRHVSPRASVGP